MHSEEFSLSIKCFKKKKLTWWCGVPSGESSQGAESVDCSLKTTAGLFLGVTFALFYDFIDTDEAEILSNLFEK